MDPDLSQAPFSQEQRDWLSSFMAILRAESQVTGVGPGTSTAANSEFSLSVSFRSCPVMGARLELFGLMAIATRFLGRVSSPAAYRRSC